LPLCTDCLDTCQGFPVGEECEDNADCENALNRDALSGEVIPLPANAKIAGGHCTNGVCECKACVAGTNCKLAVQAKAGKGQGVRFVVNSAVAVGAAISSTQASQWSAGSLLHLHTQFDQGGLNKGFVLGPGTFFDATIGRDLNHEYQGYPFTNCSNSFNIEPSLCEQNCLWRVRPVTH